MLGFGSGNLKDVNAGKARRQGKRPLRLYRFADEAYQGARDEMGATLITVAKDVKIQVEFNPAQVGEFRLIGYENRIMAHRGFQQTITKTLARSVPATR